MSRDKGEIFEILDALAMRIMIVEPGDLSTVGELLGLIEELLALENKKNQGRELGAMAMAFKATLERMIMGELADSAENYELLGKAIIQMQELARMGDESEVEALVSVFVKHISEIGYPLTLSSLLAAGEEEETLSEAPPTTEQKPANELEIDQPTPSASATPTVPDFTQDRELLGGFIDEAFEHLATIEINVLDLEQNPSDLEIINNIFRPFHTIKGVAGFLNLKTINKLAHAAENLLDDVRNGKRSMDLEVIDVVLAVGDTLKKMVENIKEVLEGGAEFYREFAISEQVAKIQSLRAGEPLPAAVTAVLPAVSGEIVTRNPENNDTLQSLANEAFASGSTATLEPSVAEIKTQKTPPPAVADQQAGGKRDMGPSIKVSVEKLDALVNAMGELVIMQSLIRQNPLTIKIADSKLVKDFSQLKRITSDLQRTVMSMRMVPIKQTFDKMIRLVRDLSQKTGKKVNLIMEGAETEIDRNMVDSIYDPLVHMLRNSVDHGIKTPEERTRHGKSPIGTVHLRAYQKGGSVVIEIEDDGAGLNSVKIKEKAVKRGLLKPGENISDFELNNLIFMPGFSTVDQVTDVSGRGVGMDVVKKAVEKLRGQVEVRSQPGLGCLFVIRLPLTLAIIDGIIVRVGSERYIIPTIAIKESLKPERKNYHTVHGRSESLLLRGDLVPIIRLYQLFGIKPTFIDPGEAIVVVVENEGRRRALMVDELLGKEEVVIKNLGGMTEVPGVAGGTILGDGRVGLILDLAGIIHNS